MSDLLKAADDIKVLIRAFDGLRLILPIIEQVGSLEQAAKETEVAQKKVADLIVRMTKDASTLDIEIANKSDIAKSIISTAKETADAIVQKANEDCADKLKLTADTCEKNITNAKDLVNNMLLALDAAKKQTSEEVNTLNIEIEDKKKVLSNIREAIAKLTDG